MQGENWTTLEAHRVRNSRGIGEQA